MLVSREQQIDRAAGRLHDVFDNRDHPFLGFRSPQHDPAIDHDEVVARGIVGPRQPDEMTVTQPLTVHANFSAEPGDLIASELLLAGSMLRAPARQARIGSPPKLYGFICHPSLPSRS